MPFPVRPRKFTDLSGVDLSRTLARKLIPVVDTLRDLRTKFGMRPYEVHIVRTRWTGGARGLGEEYRVSDVPLLPTPRLIDLSTLSEVVSPVGIDEIGSVTLDEISGRYSEDLLACRDEDGTTTDEDLNIFYEVIFPVPDGSDSGGAPRRRFFPVSAPHYTAGRFEWVVRLERARADHFRGDTVP